MRLGVALCLASVTADVRWVPAPAGITSSRMGDQPRVFSGKTLQTYITCAYLRPYQPYQPLQLQQKNRLANDLRCRSLNLIYIYIYILLSQKKRYYYYYSGLYTQDWRMTENISQMCNNYECATFWNVIINWVGRHAVTAGHTDAYTYII